MECSQWLKVVFPSVTISGIAKGLHSLADVRRKAVLLLLHGDAYEATRS